MYVGNRVCAGCHEGPAAGGQYSKWLLSKHSLAFAALAGPEAKAMARLSGIPDDPEKSPICLGCHATAADTEPWEKDGTSSSRTACSARSATDREANTAAWR